MPAQEKAALAQAAALTEELGREKVSALVPGEKDLAFGLGRYIGRMKAAELPVLASNLLDAKTGKAPFPGHRIEQIDRLKVGLSDTSYSADDTPRVTPGGCCSFKIYNHCA